MQWQKYIHIIISVATFFNDGNYFHDASIALGEQPVANVHSALHDRFWTWEFGVDAAAPRLCSVYAHAETLRRTTAALGWAPVLSSLHAVLIGDTNGKQAAALTWWSESVRRLRVTDWRTHSSSLSSGPPHLTPSHAVAEPEHFHRGGQSGTIAHTGAARKLICEGCKLLWLRLSFLVTHLF